MIKLYIDKDTKIKYKIDSYIGTQNRTTLRGQTMCIV